MYVDIWEKHEKLRRIEELTESEVVALQNLRKQIWDEISVKWAKDEFATHVIIILPQQSFKENSTLNQIEWPNIPEHHKICFLIFDCESQQVLKNQTVYNVNDIHLTASDFVSKAKASVAFEKYKSHGKKQLVRSCVSYMKQHE